MNELPQTKMCKSCGQEKPLSDFSQLQGPQGTIYGGICAACRKAHLEKLAASDPGDNSTRKTGVTIDSKVKVQLEINHLEKQKHIEESNLEERKEIETDLNQLEKNQITEEKEKKHRNDIIKHSLLNQPKNPSQAIKPKEIPGSEAQKADKEIIDFNAPTEFTREGATVRTQSSVFEMFKQRLGESAAIVKATRKARNNPASNTPENAAMKPLNEEINHRRGPNRKN